MAVPKKKTSKSKSKMRVSHVKRKLSTVKYIEDKTSREYRVKKIINPTK